MTDNINPETGEVEHGRSPRFTMWVALFVFATIVMGSAVEQNNINKSEGQPNAAGKWAVACSIATFAVTAVIVIAHMVGVCSTLIVGTKIEGIISFILAACWATVVSIVTNIDNGLATGDYEINQVVNGNLYYFSWAGFVTAVILLINYLKQAFGVDAVGEMRARAARLSLWAGFLASSLVVMGSAVRILNRDCQGDREVEDMNSTYCKRDKLAIGTGSFGVCIALLIIGVKLVARAAPLIVEFVTTIFLTILNAISVAYVTSPKGPGSIIGNLYYFSWISFLCCAMLMADCYNQYSHRGVDSADNKRDDDQTGDIEVENLEDQI